jgi:O-antigen/teichoic acid export membrane protein
LRATVVLIPLAALVAGTSHEVVRTIFGAEFSAAAPLLARLFAAAAALTVTAVSVAILTAANRNAIVTAIGLGVLAAAIAGHSVLIPQSGAIGAANVTLVTATAGSLLALAAVHRIAKVQVFSTLARAVLIAIPAYWGASAIGTSGAFGLIAKFSLISAGILAAFIALGELSGNEMARLKAAVGRAQPRT